MLKFYPLFLQGVFYCPYVSRKCAEKNKAHTYQHGRYPSPVELAKATITFSK